MDISQYKELFINEAQEHLEALNQAMVDLERDPENPDVLTEIFRSAHTLKGMSATMGFDQLTELSHEMENVLDGLRSGDIEVNTDIVDLLFGCFDMLASIVASIAEESGEVLDTGPLIGALRGVYMGGRGGVAEKAGKAKKRGAKKRAPEKPSGEGEEKEPAPGGLAGERVSSGKATAGEEGPGPGEPPETEGKEEAPAERVPAAHEEAGELRNLRLRVTLDKDCVLKSVRVFMIFKKLSQLGRVVDSNPSVEDLEDEKFDRSFEVLLSSAEDAGEVRRALMTIAEVQEVQALPLEGGLEVEAGPVAEETPEEAVSERPRPEGERAPVTPVRTQSVRVNISRLDNLMNLIGELVINRTRLQEISSSYNIPELKEALAHTARLTADLQDEVMKTRMVPVEHIFNRFPRMVRDLAKSRGKEVDFVIEGRDIELDRTILDEISDPLMHMLRNAVDHGIDSPEEREARGKPRRGSIKLAARRDRNYVSIEVQDDGQGVDAEKVFALAVERGFVSPDEARSLSEEDSLRFLAMPGFSTAEEVSGVSGRGVGRC